jgi:hypothetical protein
MAILQLASAPATQENTHTMEIPFLAFGVNSPSSGTCCPRGIACGPSWATGSSSDVNAIYPGLGSLKLSNR